MKLPDFRQFQPMNALRHRMGADKLGQFAPNIHVKTLSEVDLIKLRTGGIELESLDEIRVLDDGTLAYKDSRVLVYIRDISTYRAHKRLQEQLPKFHLSNCDTLRKMRQRNRFERYVISTRDDGQFEVRHIQEAGDPVTELLALNVCKNCLDELKFNGYQRQTPLNIRLQLFSEFKLEDYFTQYPRSPINRPPLHTDRTSPLNDYTDDFEFISKRLKAEKGWVCPHCHVDLSAPQLRRYLHSHHKNGRKNDNRPSNLEVMCIGCHADQPMHGHLKRLPEYLNFQRMREQGVLFYA